MTKLGNSGIYYSDETFLGLGASSVVYPGYYKSPEKRAAIKRVCSKHADVCKMEIKIWLTVNDCVQRKENVNIVQLYHWIDFRSTDSTTYYFAMERATCNMDGWLERIRDNGDPDWKRKVVKYLNDAVNGLSWLHTKRIIHRDIKPENILIFCMNDDINKMGIAKLGDFGISKIITGSSTGTDSNGKGTSDWMPPEAIKAMTSGKIFENTKAIDIFSLGSTAHYSLTKGVTHPFLKLGTCITANILAENTEPSKLGNGEYMADHLFQWMMAYKPSERLRIMQVQCHPLFWSVTKQLGFLLDVAKCLDNPRSDEFQEAKDLMDGFYLDRHPKLNWKNVLSSTVYDLLTKRKNPPKNCKKMKDPYNKNSVFSLIKLIRDKDVHNADLNDELISEKYFGRRDENRNLIYCEEKYAQFFFRMFPDLVIFLFVFLVNETDLGKIRTVQSVKFKYGLNKYWAKIPIVAKY